MNETPLERREREIEQARAAYRGERERLAEIEPVSPPVDVEALEEGAALVGERERERRRNPRGEARREETGDVLYPPPYRIREGIPLRHPPRVPPSVETFPAPR